MAELDRNVGMAWPSVDVVGVNIHCVDFADTLQQIAAWVALHRTAQNSAPLACTNDGSKPPICRQISTVNPEFVVDAHRDPAFADILAQVDLRVPDGIGVLWAANRSGASLRERVTGSDGIDRICREAAAKGWRVFFLGAAPGVVDAGQPDLNALLNAQPTEEELLEQQRLEQEFQQGEAKGRDHSG